MPRRLVLWVIDEAHRKEQQVSEASVKKWMPDVETVCIVFPQGGLWYQKYIEALIEVLHTDDDKYIVLDSDTFLTESIEDVFGILDKYDVVSTHAPARQTTNMPAAPKIPEGYCEFNTGLFGFVNNYNVNKLFQRWHELYHEHLAITGDNDQAPLRMAMWELGTKAWVLPPEFNARMGFGMFAGGRIKVLHLRYPNASLEKVAEWANAEGGMRLLSSKDLPR